MQAELTHLPLKYRKGGLYTSDYPYSLNPSRGRLAAEAGSLQRVVNPL
jgi:hypothetical protein